MPEPARIHWHPSTLGLVDHSLFKFKSSPVVAPIPFSVSPFTSHHPIMLYLIIGSASAFLLSFHSLIHSFPILFPMLNSSSSPPSPPPPLPPPPSNIHHISSLESQWIVQFRSHPKFILPPSLPPSDFDLLRWANAYGGNIGMAVRKFRRHLRIRQVRIQFNFMDLSGHFLSPTNSHFFPFCGFCNWTTFWMGLWMELMKRPSNMPLWKFWARFSDFIYSTIPFYA